MGSHLRTLYSEDKVKIVRLSQEREVCNMIWGRDFVWIILRGECAQKKSQWNSLSIFVARDSGVNQSPTKHGLCMLVKGATVNVAFQ